MVSLCVDYYKFCDGMHDRRILCLIVYMSFMSYCKTPFCIGPLQAHTIYVYARIRNLDQILRTANTRFFVRLV